MFIHFEDRLSDSPLVERVWRCRSERAGTFLSVAANHLEIVITRHRGRMFATLRGPETKVSQADCPADGEWLAIRFKAGTFLPHHPASTLLDRQDEILSAASNRRFLLDGDAWEFFDFENAETFVARLARRGVIRRDDAVDASMQGERRALSRRSTQRHFLHATGMTHSMFRQIERARHATNLLRQGVSILDSVYEAGYFDQAHLTRSLTHFIGQTPGRILRAERQLSFLYKTTPSAAAYDARHDDQLEETLDGARAQHARHPVPAV
ncbi:MAG: helix-turn-helix domain-containing protein [Acidobacteriota bacterium]